MRSKGRQAVAACLAGLLLAGTGPHSLAAEKFADVPQNAWYASAVDYVSEAGLFAGVGGGKFAPHAPMSRAMLVTVLSQRSGGAEEFQKYYNVTAPAWGDIPDGSWHEMPVKWAKYAGLISGRGQGLFAPDDSVTRQEAAVILYQYARATGHEVSHSGRGLDRFPDRESAAPWAREALCWAAESQLLAGLPDGSLQPGGILTRAQGAVVLRRLEAVAPGKQVTYPMTETADALGVTAENYPQVAGGSLTLQTELYRAMYGDVLPPEGRLGPASAAGAWQALANGEAELILVPHSPEDVEALAGDMDLERVELGRSALVFYTCGENTASGLTLEQAKDIYQGSLISWQALGGPERPLVVLDSDRAQDDSRLQLERLILQGGPVSAPAQMAEGNMLRLAAWAQNPEDAYNLGFGRFHASLDFPDIPAGSLKPLAFEGVSPTGETVADGSYPLGYSYYAVYRGDLPEGHPVRGLVSWLQSQEGKGILLADVGVVDG